MGVTYKATIKIKCWKQHECVGCGGQYRYRFERTVTGEGGNEDAAGRAAEKAAVTAVAKDVDQRPCPRCGCVQPDMIAQKKSNTHFWIALLLLILSAVVLIFGGVSSATWMPYSLASVVLVVLSLVGLVVHATVALGDPNKNKDANKDRAERMIDGGEMEQVAKGDDDLASGEPKAVAGGSMVLLGLGALAVALIVAPFILKTVSGWPTVPDTKPEVVGPGDTVTVWFPNKISSVKGYWNGSPAVTVVNGGGVDGPLSLSAASKTDSWGSSMYVKSSEKSNTQSVWADVKIPDNPALVGKTIELRVDIALRYPVAAGNSFNEQTSQMSTTAKYTLTGRNAGGTYRMTYWVCVLGAVLFAVAGFGLMASANGLRKHAAPADVTPIEDPKRRNRDDDEDDDGGGDPRRDRRRSRDDDDDRPRRDRDRDDEDDRPRRRRDRDRDDEDDRPRRRRYDD